MNSESSDNQLKMVEGMAVISSLLQDLLATQKELVLAQREFTNGLRELTEVLQKDATNSPSVHETAFLTLYAAALVNSGADDTLTAALERSGEFCEMVSRLREVARGRVVEVKDG